MNISRRTMLRASGTAVALPLMESLAGADSTGAKPPRRLIFLNFGFGPSQNWYPGTNDRGRGFELTEAMQPLARHRESFSVLSNLTNIKSSEQGAHWGATTFLTGADVRRTPGREFHNSISCDQIAAAQLGREVRFPSLSLTAPENDVPGCGPGSSLSWNVIGDPIQGLSDHVAIFSRLFGDGGMTLDERRQALNRRRSVLDAVRGNAKDVHRKVNARDREKVEEYFALVRGIEGQLAREEDWMSRPKPKAPFAAPSQSPIGTPGIELMFDLMAAALQTDSTRVITYRLPTASVLQEFSRETGIAGIGAHSMTHYGLQNSNAWKQLVWRDRKLCDLFATLLDKLKATPDLNGDSLLDNTLVVMGSGLRTGHQRRNLPILLAGGRLKHGAHYVHKENETPLANLWLSLLKYTGCEVDSFADSTGPLTEMFG